MFHISNPVILDQINRTIPDKRKKTTSPKRRGTRWMLVKWGHDSWDLHNAVQGGSLGTSKPLTLALCSAMVAGIQDLIYGGPNQSEKERYTV